MRLVYLGWPRCGSSWLHRLVSSNSSLADLGGEKESHLFYTNPARGLKEFNDGMMDFSTNNWSMDSWVAERLRGSRFIFVHRNPLDVMISYHARMKFDWDQWLHACEHNRLIDTGDVLERWVGLVGDDLTIYEFSDLERDPIQFGRGVLNDLGLPCGDVDPHPINESPTKIPGKFSPEFGDRVQRQEQKFRKIAQNARYVRWLTP